MEPGITTVFNSRKKRMISHKMIERLRTAKRVVVITGAGISAESGVPTFRGSDGLWRQYRAEELATLDAFRRDPRLVWEWYDWRRRLIARKEPNAGHLAIAAMEGLFEQFLLITQNVDGLHRKAGNRKLIEIHGNIWRVRCMEEGRVFEHEEVPLKEVPPRCECGTYLRPDVIWFGESLSEKDLADSHAALRECDCLLVVGTSAVVQPVASFPAIARNSGAFIVEINVEPTPISGWVDESILGKSGQVLPQLLENMK
jgi:NAD-dependent deacetylase